MLKLTLGTVDRTSEDTVNDISRAFRGIFFPDLIARVDRLADPISAEIIKGVDKATKVGIDAVENPFGRTLIYNLSNGCKSALIAVHRPDLIVSNLEMGNNVLPVLAEVANKYGIDIKIKLELPYIETDSEELCELEGNIMPLTDASDLLSERIVLEE